jgi:uncharacterized RDD family membrane protein YckC
MQLTCPHCGFSKEVPAQQLPPGVARASCPQCKKSFPLVATAPPGAVKSAEPEAETAEVSVAAGSSSAAWDQRPKAGFWIRLVAALIDGFLLFWLQFGLGLLLFLAGITSGGPAEGSVGTLALLVQLFTYAIGIAYYVVFTGHGGQTPGKMAVRIKVIRRDGQPISYGRAFFRELPGKFLSAVILGIGFLMIAFDDQKQGLHDRLADTYVIKL